jgi:hypothetical protein
MLKGKTKGKKTGPLCEGINSTHGFCNNILNNTRHGNLVPEFGAQLLEGRRLANGQPDLHPLHQNLRQTVHSKMILDGKAACRFYRRKSPKEYEVYGHPSDSL